MNRSPTSLVAVALVASLASVWLVEVARAKELKLVESKRPFIDFEIKQLNYEIESRKRAFLEVKDLATGAAYLHESLFTNKNHVRCSAYGHLANLMKNNPKKSGQLAGYSIRLSTIQELAVVVQRNWPYYHKLLEQNSSEYGDLFRKIIESLLYSKQREQFANSRDVALDLINCLRALTPTTSGKEQTHDQQQQQQLEHYERAINLWLMFKSQPILSKRRSKIERKQTPTEAANSQLFYQEALVSIGNIDSATRINLNRPVEDGAVFMPKDTTSLKANGTLIESHEPLGVWLYLDRPASEEDKKLKFPIFHREQLKVLNFVKFRLNDKRGREFPVDVSLAIDFQTHWNALKNYVTKTNRPTKIAIEFFKNKDNAKLAKTIAYNLKLYGRFAIVFHRLSRKNFKFPSMKDYCNAIRKTKESLNKINKFDLIDIEDIYRVFDFWFMTHKRTCDVYWPSKNAIFEISK